MFRSFGLAVGACLLATAGTALAHKNHQLAPATAGSNAEKPFKEVSAACQVGDYTFLVGDEESYPLWIVKGTSVQSVDISASALADVEAITAISDTEVLLVCSQVLSDDGSYKKKRTRLGLLSFPDGLDKPSKMAIHDGLRDDILPFLEGHADKFKDFTALSTKPPRDGGLSIEGAAYDQKTGILYLGTRDGVTRREGSVIIELKNVKDMIATNAKPVFGNLYQLPSVEYSGIRDLSLQGDKLLVLLGAMRGRSTPPATLAWWSLTKPEELEVIEVDGIASIKDAEAVYIDPTSKEVMVVQDLNDEKVGAALDDIAHGFDLKTAKIRPITRPTPVPGTPKPAAPAATTSTDAAKPAGPAVKPPAKPTTNKPATGATEKPAATKPAAPKATPAATK